MSEPPEQLHDDNPRNEPCGKIGCKNIGVIKGYVGCLSVWACIEHAPEIGDALGGRLSDKQMNQLRQETRP